MRKLFILLLLTSTTFALEAKTTVKPLKGVSHVVLIGSDGFSAAVLRNNPGVYKNIEKIMAMGCSTLEARSVLPSSSAVNWASMLMGAGPELHGFTEWGSKTPELPSRELNKWGLFPTIFSIIKEAKPNAIMAAGYSWDGIGYLYEQKAVDHNFFSNDNDSLLSKKMCQYITEQKPLFTFISFAQPDGTGHTIGWESPEYIDMCKQIDSYVGEILASIKEAGIESNTVVIFTADHGGTKTGHGGKQMVEMQIPFAIMGSGIKQNHKIEGSMMQYDCAATVANILGIEQPQVWVGKPILEIFEK